MTSHQSLISLIDNAPVHVGDIKRHRVNDVSTLERRRAARRRFPLPLQNHLAGTARDEAGVNYWPGPSWRVPYLAMVILTPRPRGLCAICFNGFGCFLGGRASQEGSALALTSDPRRSVVDRGLCPI